MKNEELSDENNKLNKFSFKTFFSNFNSSKKIKLVFAGVLFIIVLLIFSSSFLKPVNSSSTANQTQTSGVESYAEKTEKRLKNILSNVNGLSCVEVFVYVKSTEEVVYLKDSETITSSKDNQTVKETTVFDKNGSLTSAIVVVTKYPEIEGVLIVASGADDVKLKLKIIDAVSVILSIAPTNIEVLEGKS